MSSNIPALVCHHMKATAEQEVCAVHIPTQTHTHIYTHTHMCRHAHTHRDTHTHTHKCGLLAASPQTEYKTNVFCVYLHNVGSSACCVVYYKSHMVTFSYRS